MTASLRWLAVAVATASLLTAPAAACQGCADPPPALDRTLGFRTAAAILVLEVDPGSPAERAGLLAEDLILSLNGEPVRRYLDLQGFVAAFREEAMFGKAVLEILRPVPGGEAYSAAPVAEVRIPAERGSRAGFAAALELVVLEVPAGSAAERQGIRPWDFIERIDGARVSGMRNVLEADARAGEALRRDGRLRLTLARWKPVVTPSGPARTAATREIVLAATDPRPAAER